MVKNVKILDIIEKNCGFLEKIKKLSLAKQCV
jgi:hypothetical protein